jgi:hypothetical protein
VNVNDRFTIVKSFVLAELCEILKVKKTE